MNKNVSAIIVGIGLFIILLSVGVGYFGISYLEYLPFGIIIVYFLSTIVFGKGILWVAKLTAYFGVLLFIILGSYDKLHFPNGIQSTQLTFVITCMTITDLLYDNVVKKK